MTPTPSGTRPLKSTIYLASRSPRRRELLKQIGVPFQLFQLREDPKRGADVDEAVSGNESPAEYVVRVARTKAEVGCHYMQRRSLLQRWPVLAADTTVVCGERIIGKPERHTDLLEQLTAARTARREIDSRFQRARAGRCRGHDGQRPLG